MDLSTEAIATVASAVVGFLGVLVGVGSRMLITRMKTIETDHSTLAAAFNAHTVEVPKTYVTKDDLAEIKEGVADIRRYLMGVDYRGNEHGR